MYFFLQDLMAIMDHVDQMVYQALQAGKDFVVIMVVRVLKARLGSGLQWAARVKKATVACQVILAC